jgi:Uma2 family endonuclease
MPSFTVQPEGVKVPAWVIDLDSFSKWIDSPGFPDWGRYCYLRGDVWIDTSMEQPFVHNVVKLWISMVLAVIGREKQLGTFFADKMRLRNDDADLSCEPDGLFVSYDALQSGRVRLVPGTVSEYREFEGSPEMTLEVVSDSSEDKDYDELRELYYRSGVEEYWLVDARDEPLEIDILRRGPKGYVNSRHQAGGWVRSQVFGKAFRLIRTEGPDGNPQFTLEHRD